MNNDRELLTEALLEKYLSKKPAFVFEHTTHEYRAYYIEVYTASNSEDKEYIRRNKKLIKRFMDDGYEQFTHSKFLGFFNADSVRHNTAMIKIAKDKETEQIIAMTVYTAHWGGLKCMGGTVVITDDTELQKVAKAALMQITREDVKLWGNFVWTECSDNVERMWKDANGIQIPAAYLSLFFDDYTMESVEYSEEDEYHYSRLVGRGTVDEQRISKTIFGFPNRDVLDKYIQDRNTTLEKLCKAYGIKPDDLLNEGFYYRDAPEYLWPHLRLVRHYYGELLKGRTELTEKETETILKSIKEIYGLYGDRWERMLKGDGLWKMMFSFLSMFNRCTVTKVYKFGDTFELEEEKFPTYYLAPNVL